MLTQLIISLHISKQTDGSLLIFAGHGDNSWFSFVLIMQQLSGLSIHQKTLSELPGHQACLSCSPTSAFSSLPGFSSSWPRLQHIKDPGPCLWWFGGLFPLLLHLLVCVWSGNCSCIFLQAFQVPGPLRTTRSLSCSRWFHSFSWHSFHLHVYYFWISSLNSGLNTDTLVCWLLKR